MSVHWSLRCRMGGCAREAVADVHTEFMTWAMCTPHALDALLLPHWAVHALQPAPENWWSTT